MAKRPKDETVSKYNDDFRARLRAVRDELDLSQDEMAAALGVTYANYQKYETRSMLPLHRIELLARLSRREIEVIITGRGFWKVRQLKPSASK